MANAEGQQFWNYEGRVLPNIGLGAVAGRPNTEWGFEPARLIGSGPDKTYIRSGRFDLNGRAVTVGLRGLMARYDPAKQEFAAMADWSK